MILDFIISVIYNFINGILSHLPVAGFPTGFTTSVSSFFAGAYQWNEILPIQGIFAIVAVAVAFEVVVVGFKGTMWVIHLIRGN